MKSIGFKVLKACILALLGLTAILLAVQPSLAEEASVDSWKFSAAIYLWAPSIQGETTSGKDVDVSFSDIVDNLDFILMGGLSAQKGKLSLLVDVIYMDLEDTSNHTLHQGALINLSLTDVELTAWVVTPMVAYNIVESDRLTLDVLAGARYL